MKLNEAIEYLKENCKEDEDFVFTILSKKDAEYHYSRIYNTDITIPDSVWSEYCPIVDLDESVIFEAADFSLDNMMDPFLPEEPLEKTND